MQTSSLVGGRYRMRVALPETGSRTVWRGWDEWSDHDVLLSSIPVSGLDDERAGETRRLAGQEVRAASALGDRHAAAPRDLVADESGDLWVVTGPIGGPVTTLQTLVNTAGPPEPDRVALWGREVAEGLVDFHDAGIVHRAIGTGLIGITEDGSARLLAVAATADLVEPGSGPHVDVATLSAVLLSLLDGWVARGGGGERAAAVRAAIERAGGSRTEPARALRDQLGRVVGVPATARPGPAPGPATENGRPAATAGVPAAPGRPVDTGPDGYPWVPSGRTPDAPVNGAPPYGYPAGPGWSPPAPRPEPGRQRRRVRVAVIVGIVLVLALVGGAATASTLFRSEILGRPADQQPADAPTPPALLGDPRTVDPCSLLATEPVRQFGTPVLVPDIMSPGTCGITLTGDGPGYTVLNVRLAAPQPDWSSGGPVEQVGLLSVSRSPAEDRRCTRTIKLPDDQIVYVNADAYEGATANLCAVADAGTANATTVLSSNAVRRRPTDPPGALTQVDVCSLVDASAASRVSGLDTTRRTSGYGGWACSWGANPAFPYAPQVVAEVDRSFQLSGTPTTIGGRSVKIVPNPTSTSYPQSCTVDIVQRTFTSRDGDTRVETLEIIVYAGAQPDTKAACQYARSIAEVVAPRMPVA